MVPRKNTPPRAAWQALGVALLSALVASCGGGGGNSDDNGPVAIRTVSNRADLISDGDALVEVTAPPGLTKDGMNITLNGTDVSSAFVDQGGGKFLGVVTGMKAGANVLQATPKKGFPNGAKLTVTNAPRSGPVLSGAQVKPYYCATPTAVAQTATDAGSYASGLSGQPDADCNIPTETKYYYRTTLTAGSAAGQCSMGDPGGTPGSLPFCWQPYTSGTPSDMASTTTSDGKTVPFIVRLERGTMNRGIYDIAVLADPAAPWTATAPQTRWNQKIYYSFGASTGQPRRQTRTTISWWTLGTQLGMGYLVAQNSMTDSSQNSNRVLMAETTMMMKEHIIDTYGQVKYTLGTGCSGGSINSNTNLSIMPGTLDGVITSCTYPDSETTAIEVGDCTLLVEAYQKSQMLNLWSGMAQSDINAKKAAINGHPDQTGCQAWFNYFGSNGKAGVYNYRHVNPADTNTGVITQDATQRNNCDLPNSQVYDPANPSGTANLPRCNGPSWAASIWGTVPGSPAALSTPDNEGVQYGLGALLAGKITAEEFVTLNEVIGGNDRDLTPRAQRSIADTAALNIAYRSGIVASGKNLAKGAIIDLRGWDDSQVSLPPGLPGALGIHHQWYSWAVRDRITRDAGDAENQALWRFARTGLSAPGTTALDAINNMDQWLTTLVTDRSNAAIELKVRRARPASSKDFCYLTSDTTQSTKVYDQATCDADPFLKPAASPRQVAGGPRSEDVLKCQLKPLSQFDYPNNTFSGSQWSRLQAVFPSGVCDFSKPGVGQQSVSDTPLTFKAGPGGQPLGAAPTSSRL